MKGAECNTVGGVGTVQKWRAQVPSKGEGGGKHQPAARGNIHARIQVLSQCISNCSTDTRKLDYPSKTRLSKFYELNKMCLWTKLSPYPGSRQMESDRYTVP